MKRYGLLLLGTIAAGLAWTALVFLTLSEVHPRRVGRRALLQQLGEQAAGCAAGVQRQVEIELQQGPLQARLRQEEQVHTRGQRDVLGKRLQEGHSVRMLGSGPAGFTMLSLLIALLTSLIPAPQEPIPPVSEPATQEGAAEATQEPERPSRRPSRRSIELAPNDPEALAFLAQLVEAQRVEEDLPPVDAFRMEFELRDFVPDRGMNELEVRVDYRSENRSAEPPVLEAIRLYANDANYNEQVAKGLDDDGYWLRDNEGELLTLEAKEYANDREAIDATLVFCQDFLLLFDLDRLRQRAGGLKRIDHEQGTILEGELVRRRTERWKFQLFVPKDGDFPTRLALELPPVPKKEAPAEQQDAVLDKAVQWLMQPEQHPGAPASWVLPWLQRIVHRRGAGWRRALRIFLEANEGRLGATTGEGR